MVMRGFQGFDMLCDLRAWEYGDQKTSRCFDVSVAFDSGIMQCSRWVACMYTLMKQLVKYLAVYLDENRCLEHELSDFHITHTPDVGCPSCTSTLLIFPPSASFHVVWSIMLYHVYI